MTNIFIANLDFGITSDDLRATFEQFGAVSYAHVVYDPKTKKSKGFGYIEMEVVEEAINAIESLNGLEVNGRKIDVKIASPKGNRPKKTEPSAKKDDKKPFKPKNIGTKPKNDDAEEKPKRVLRPRRKRL